MDETRTRKVGAVAEAAGLTVRTLHHWDHTETPRAGITAVRHSG